MEPQDNLSLDSQERTEDQDLTEPQEERAKLDFQEFVDHQETLSTDFQDHQDHVDHKDLRDTTEETDLLDFQDFQD